MSTCVRVCVCLTVGDQKKTGVCFVDRPVVHHETHTTHQNTRTCRIRGGNHHTPSVSIAFLASRSTTDRPASKNFCPVIAMRTVANLVRYSMTCVVELVVVNWCGERG